MMPQHAQTTQPARHFGIDVAKDHLDIHCLEEKRSWRIANTAEAIQAFIRAHRALLQEALVVIDSTGGHEQLCCRLMAAAGCRVHVAHSYRFRSYVRSCGQMAKTDRIDARMLAQYGRERGCSLRLYAPQDRVQRRLRLLVSRREQLVQMLTAEKNRLQAPDNAPLAPSIRRLMQALEREIETIKRQIRRLLQRNEALKRRRALLLSIPGIGEVIAATLLALMPELGRIGNRQAAALAGLAPFARDSGRQRGRRRLGPGRLGVRRVMFIAAMVAVQQEGPLRAFYERLLARGKKPILALAATARKMLVIINARLRDMMAEAEPA